MHVERARENREVRGSAKSHVGPGATFFVDSEDILVARWVDAAHANRPDGGSAKGVLVGCSSSRLLEGQLDVVSTIYWTPAKSTKCADPVHQQKLEQQSTAMTRCLQSDFNLHIFWDIHRTLESWMSM